MKNYPYLQRLMSENPVLRFKFAERVAQRASDGGDVDELLDICDMFGSDFRTWVLEQMSELEGCKLLHLRLWFRRYRVSSIYRFSELFEIWNSADDSDECIEWLVENSIIESCEDCGEYELCQNMRGHYSDNDARVCPSCIDNSYRWSDYYDNYVYEDSARNAIDQDGDHCVIHCDDDDFEYDDDDEQYVHVNYNREPQYIHSYHSSKGSQRPQQSPWSKLRGRYLGVELEVECRDVARNEKAKLLHQLINKDVYGASAFFENDGSLNNGFEIITQPMGLDKHRELWQWLNDKQAIRGLRSHNTSTCGLHVHISRDKLTKLQVAKIVSFINDPDNESLIRAVARRYAEGYCKIKVKKIGQSAQSEDRYEAVNITPRKTIEFRIFKGSLKYESVMSAIQFCNSLVDFCGRANTSIRDLKADNFLDFIRADESGDTDILVPYLENRLELA